MFKIILIFVLSTILFAKHFSVSYDPDYAPFSYTQDKKPYGLFIDIWQLWATKNGHTLSFIPAKDWDDAIDLAKQKKVDFFLGTTPYEKWMQSSETYYKTKSVFFFLRNSKKQLHKIGIIGTDYKKTLQEKLPHATIHSYETYEKLVHALLQNEVNAIYDDALAISFFAIKHGYSHLLSRSDILSEISDVKAISATKENVELFSKGFKKLSLKELETIESNWIEDQHARYYNNAHFLKKKSYRFIYHPNNKPLEFTNENGVYSGIIADILSLISSKSCLKFTSVQTKTWEESFKRFQSDPDIEMISAIEPTPSIKQKYNLTQKDIFSFNAVLLSQKTQEVSSSFQNLTIGIVHNELATWLEKNYKGIHLIQFDSFDEALSALKDSQIDLLATNSIKATYTINVLSQKKLKIARILPYKFHLKIAFKQSVQKEVLALLDETLSMISNKEKSDIYHKWTTLVIKKELDTKLIFTIVTVFITIIAFFILINKRLNTLVQQRTAELKELNENLEQKVEQRTKELIEINKKMEDNIRYASFIQNAILPSSHEFARFFKDYFIYWEPKDIVGGDIYFFEISNEDEAYLFVIDCTGHGVSGAFLTMLVKAIQEQLLSTLSQKKHTPASILQDINTILKKLLPQEDSQANVGLDAGIIYINKKEQTLSFSGANIPLYYIEKDQLHILKPNRTSIGYTKSKKDYHFTEQTLKYKDDIYFYITTDGFIDQNGGEKEFPFGKKRFKTLLLQHYKKAMLEQKEIYKKALLEYQGKHERNDDITLIGFSL